MTQPPHKKSADAKINLTVSLVFHGTLIAAIFFFAAREGMLGKKLKEITVTLAPKEKKPEPPKEKPPEPKAEIPKLAENKPVVVPQAQAEPPPPAATVAAPPPAASAAPAVASLPSFEFSDGARQVDSLNDPNAVYKALVEHSLRARWNRPDDLADDNFTAEVEISIDKKGNVEGYRWVTGSGNKKWDDSIKASMDSVKSINRPPPKDFPNKFVARFDVEILQSAAPGLQ